MTDLAASPLGHATTYSDSYDPALLFAVERAPLRATIGITSTPPFHGEDVWNAYELSWLTAAGKPQVAIATMRVPASSPSIVESKSVKLYLTGFNQTRFASTDDVISTIRRDIAQATRADVGIELIAPDRFTELEHAEPTGTCIDDLPVAIDEGAPDAALLSTHEGDASEALYSRLFRSVCPVTGQPDFATVVLRYTGARIDRASLLRYLVSFRRQPGFHEHCVETIFMDVLRRCAPRELEVHARFTRRGGIDINPYRSTRPMPPHRNARTAQQ